MKRYLLVAIATLLVTLVSGCADSPKRVFDAVALNANLVPHRYDQLFGEIRENKDKGMLMIYDQEAEDLVPGTALEYAEFSQSKRFEAALKSVKSLQETDEVKPIKQAAVELFTYADELHKTDVMRIAKMIDDDVSDDEIDAAIIELEATKGEELQRLREKTMNLVIPYADRHGIEYKVMERRF